MQLRNKKKFLFYFHKLHSKKKTTKMGANIIKAFLKVLKTLSTKSAVIYKVNNKSHSNQSYFVFLARRQF